MLQSYSFSLRNYSWWCLGGTWKGNNQAQISHVQEKHFTFCTISPAHDYVLETTKVNKWKRAWDLGWHLNIVLKENLGRFTVGGGDMTEERTIPRGRDAPKVIILVPWLPLPDIFESMWYSTPGISDRINWSLKVGWTCCLLWNPL